VLSQWLKVPVVREHWQAMFERDGSNQTIDCSTNGVSASAATPIQRCCVLKRFWEDGLDDSTSKQQIARFCSMPLISAPL
jgi:hypothetical protein